MATKPEMMNLFELLATVYPPNEVQKRHLDGLISVWLRTFAKTPDPVLRRAVELHIGKAIFFPKPAEILALLSEADYQVSEEERQANAAEILSAECAWQESYRPLYARFRELEDAYWHNGEFDCEAWEALIAGFEQAGCPQSAQASRARRDQFQAESAPAVLPVGMAVSA